MNVVDTDEKNTVKANRVEGGCKLEKPDRGIQGKAS